MRSIVIGVGLMALCVALSQSVQAQTVSKLSFSGDALGGIDTSGRPLCTDNDDQQNALDGAIAVSRRAPGWEKFVREGICITEMRGENLLTTGYGIPPATRNSPIIYEVLYGHGTGYLVVQPPKNDRVAQQ